MGGGGFVKLFASIVTSTVWCEPDYILRIWIAMLATCDVDGIVYGTVPGFASLARVSPDQMREAIAKFTAPDHDSRTQLYEGRRVEVIDGGWRILNYKLYRERGQGKDGSRASYFRDYRKRDTRVDTNDTVANGVAQQSNGVAQHDSVARNTEERREKEEERGKSPASPGVLRPSRIVVKAWSAEACDDWNERFGDGTAHGGRIGRELKPLVDRYGWPAVREAWRNYLGGKKATFANPADFRSKYGEWVSSQAPAGATEEEPF